MPISGFRRIFSYDYIVYPYYEDFTDPDDFIVYSNDVGAVMLYDDVTGFSVDGTYYILYEFSGGVVDTDNAGMWVEYRYTRDNGGIDRVVHSRSKRTPFEAVTSWELETLTGGSSATEVFLSAAMSIPTYINDLKDNIGAEDAEDKFPGSWSVVRSISGPVNNSSNVLVCEFELRHLAIKNLRCEEPVFDPCAEVNFTTIKADILALPVGWEPDSVGVTLTIDTDSLSGLTPFTDNYSLTLGTPDSSGKVAEVEVPWDGTRVNFTPSDGTHPLATEPVEGLFNVRVEAFAAPNAQAFDKYSKVRSLRCSCRCPGSHPAGVTFLSLPMPELVTTPYGPPLQIPMAYCTACFDAAPSSMGYGWRSTSSCRIFEDLTSGAISYRNEVGNNLRWILDGSDYVPTTSDNRIAIRKESDPDATYVLTFEDQSVREFDADGLLKRDLDRNGNALIYSHSSGVLTSMTDAAGNVMTLDYTGRSDGQPVEISCGTRSTTLTYDVNERLESITDPEGESTSFVYNAEGLLWKILDARDEEAMVYEYDEEGRVVTETSYGLKRVDTIYGEAAESALSNLEVVSLAHYYHCIVRTETDLTDIEAPVRTVALALNHLGAVILRAEVVEEGVVNATFSLYEDEHHSHLPTKVIQPNGSVTEMFYNERGDLVGVRDNDGNFTDYFYTEDHDDPPFNPK